MLYCEMLVLYRQNSTIRPALCSIRHLQYYARNYAGIMYQPLFGRTKSHRWRQELIENYVISKPLLDTWISRGKKTNQPVNVPTYVNTDRFETSPLKNWRHFSTEITRLLGSARKTTLPVHFWGWLSLKALNPRVKSELIEA